MKLSVRRTTLFVLKLFLKRRRSYLLSFYYPCCFCLGPSETTEQGKYRAESWPQGSAVSASTITTIPLFKQVQKRYFLGTLTLLKQQLIADKRKFLTRPSHKCTLSTSRAKYFFPKTRLPPERTKTKQIWIDISDWLPTTRISGVSALAEIQWKVREVTARDNLISHKILG